MASTAIRPGTPEDVAIRDKNSGLRLDAEYLPAPIKTGFRVYAMGPE
jgi:hypothetical protein